MLVKYEDYLAHYGTLHKSGRYPWGSGGPENQRNRSFLDTIDDLKSKGLTDKEIYQGLGMTSTEYRARKSIAKHDKRQADIDQATRLKEKGLSDTAIGERMGRNESSIRALLDPATKEKNDILYNVANVLKEQVGTNELIDVGSGVEHQLGVSSTKLNNSLALLKQQGYEVHPVKIAQGSSGNFTNYKVLCAPGTTRKDVFLRRDEIRQPTKFSNDGGRTMLGIHPPMSIDSKRIKVRYANEGGADADGVIFVREGVPDVSLGKARYAQVRIAVDGTHYLKGMAMYKDDLPPGVDLVFNTNKNNTGNKHDAMKPMKTDVLTGKIDKDNPFGSTIKPGGQILSVDKKGKATVTSVMNKVNEEGDWSNWSKSLSSQILSKQNPSLIRAQLNLTQERRVKEFNELNNLTNPVVRRKLLIAFGDETDKAAVNLKASALNAGQKNHVILPIESMNPNQVYAPNFKNGERVVLIRHPHAGRFEIPELVVNNRQPEAKRLIGNARDAIGIHSSVAKRLSGADFDGDTVLVIPNNSGKIKTAPALEGLKDFDPISAFPAYPGMKRITEDMKQNQMGIVSNLITDMTIMKASSNEMARAVRHSMVIIDAEKHNLNYKESYKQNGIQELQRKYQGSGKGGAVTLISRGGGKIRVPRRVDRKASDGGPIDKDTGERVYTPTGRTYTNAKGQVVPNTQKIKRLALTNDARTLMSGPPPTVVETIYAEHSNNMKHLANKARKIAVNIPRSEKSPTAARVYANEVASLNHKLALVVANRPRERQARTIANAVVKQKRQANPDMDKDQVRKIETQAIEEARIRMGAKHNKVIITPKEWEAIQAHAISDNQLTAILNKADLDVVRDLATPKQKKLMTSVKTAEAKRLLDMGFTRSEVAARLGVSVTTLDTAVSE